MECLIKKPNTRVNVSGKSRVEDMALMSECDHTILTAGTYGTFSSFLKKNGTTIYPDIIGVADHYNLAPELIRKSQLPNWIKIKML